MVYAALPSAFHISWNDRRLQRVLLQQLVPVPVPCRAAALPPTNAVRQLLRRCADTLPAGESEAALSAAFAVGGRSFSCG